MSLTNGLKRPSPSMIMILGVLALTLLPASSHAVVFDFESETVQIGQAALVVGVPFMTATITRTPGTGTLGVVDPTAFGTAPVAFGNRSLLPDAGFPTDSLLITFSSPTRLVKVNFGDAAGDDDSLVVITTNTGVSSSAIWSATDLFTRFPPADNFGTLSVYDPAGFTSVTLSSGSDGTPGYTGDTTLFWDNLQVPEPTTILLLGVGLGALALYRRRRNG